MNNENKIGRLKRVDTNRYLCPAAANEWAKRVLLFLLLICCAVAYGDEQKMYRTGLEATKGRFSVSPDGRRLVFDTDRIAHGLRLLDLDNGKITILPAEVGRTFESPSWSPDGRQVVVVSIAVRDNRYSAEDERITLLDAITWQPRTISLSEGVKSFPFFSADGKTVYYFNGRKRESGKTIASRYDLFAIDLASGHEKKLTDEAFYQVGKGHDDEKTVLFRAMGGNRFKDIKDAFGQESAPALFLYDKVTGSVAPIRFDQSSGVFNFSTVQRDRAGSLFFVAARARPGGGNFLWSLFKCTANGKNLMALTELPIGLRFDIAKNTGEIYVMDKDGEDLIVRKLTATAAH